MDPEKKKEYHLLCSELQFCCCLVTKSCPGSSVQGISQARILEWVAISSSRDIPNQGIKPESPVSLALRVDSSPLEPLGKHDIGRGIDS